MGETNKLAEGSDSSQETNIKIRKYISDAFSFIEGSKSVQTFSAFTVEEAHDQFIERIEGEGTALRPNAIAKIDRVASRISAAIASIKAQPSESFRDADSGDVNT